MAATRVPVCYIDDPIILTHFIDLIYSFRTEPPALFFDVQGHSLGRKGRISLISVYSPLIYKIYIIDVNALGAATFDTAGTVMCALCERKKPKSEAKNEVKNEVKNGDKNEGDKDEDKHNENDECDGKVTLRAILQNWNIPKVFFDVRSPSDALYGIYGIKLCNVLEVQLLECAVSGRMFVPSLDNTVRDHANIDSNEKEISTTLRTDGKNFFINKFGALDQRPLHIVMERYCVNQILFLPMLYNTLFYRLNDDWMTSVKTMSKKRLEMTQAPNYAPRESDRWNPWRFLESCNPTPRL